jgi:hypothetical protein
MKEAFVLLLLIGTIFWWVLHSPPALPPPGVRAPEEPVQTSTTRPEWDWKGYHLKALAEYIIKARVLGREAYWMDGGAKVSPLDFALGWGRMSDPAIYSKMHISQGGRYYHYSWTDEPPIPADEIVRSSANTHLIPATPEVKSDLDLVQAGDVTGLSGCLVVVSGANGWHWTSSTSRTDSGGGACELMWVERVRLYGR